MMDKNDLGSTATEGMKAPCDIPMRLTVHPPKGNGPMRCIVGSATVAADGIGSTMSPATPTWF